jgi:hypothetical protein
MLIQYTSDFYQIDASLSSYWLNFFTFLPNSHRIILPLIATNLMPILEKIPRRIVGEEINTP